MEVDWLALGALVAGLLLGGWLGFLYGMRKSVFFLLDTIPPDLALAVTKAIKEAKERHDEEPYL